MTNKDFKIKNSIVVDDVVIDLTPSTNSGGLVYSSSTNTFSSTSGNIPIGVVRMWASGSTSPSVPDDYLICDGRQDLSQTTYADLYAVIGNRFTQSPNGSTFGLPSFNSSTKQYPLVLGVDALNHSAPNFNQTANENTSSIGTNVSLSHSHQYVNISANSITSANLGHSHGSNYSDWTHGHDYTVAAGSDTRVGGAHNHNTGNASTAHSHSYLSGNGNFIETAGMNAGHSHSTGNWSGGHSHTDQTANHGHSIVNSNAASNVHSHTFDSGTSQISVSHTHSIGTAGFYFIIRYR
jgi:hypothetical protein